ncbi:DUF4166 domain-containing protein [Denitrobaculum tricleocarpae]|uniref:DUF4166 domain-containing protein n=1 Tax=Denitrobaculum tricleocarpae TaxID=2591009 RepID=A0A545TQU5_9PROT|nr:DUF4166 domain-containing protein [Denitrobaculum tricleocarpae]TQV79592.1 DUF4166 domain-containing protein [Denitrobaculum tricleocarpae]
MADTQAQPEGDDVSDASSPSMYRQIIGGDYDRLPPLVRNMHEVKGRHTARGRGRVERGSNFAGRRLADFLGMPPEAADIPVETTFFLDQGAETITRNYNGAILITRQAIAKSRSAVGEALLLEKFGPVALFLALEGTEEGITFHLRRCSLLGLKLPRMLSPRLVAREQVRGGRYHYFVRIELPLIGSLIEYEGLLELEKATN